jgi:hypothetical protein
LDDLEFLPIMHYAPANLASRLVYVVPPVRDFAGELYMRGQPFYRGPGAVESLVSFLATHDTFLIHSNARSFYRLDYFIRKGANLRIESASFDSFLVSATLKKNTADQQQPLSTGVTFAQHDSNSKRMPE